MTLKDLPKPFIIADVGSNWRRYDDQDKNLLLAKRHIVDAAICGVSAVKFQLYTHRELYGFDGDDTYALPSYWLPELAACAAQNSVEFMCSAFSADGVRAVDPWVNVHKIASAEMKHIGIINAVVDTGKPFFVSNGGAHFDEIDWFRRNFRVKHMMFLECTAAYPAEVGDYRLSGGVQGISDHTTGYTLAIAAVGAGASVFEKHFDAMADGANALADQTPDAPVSCGPTFLKNYCHSILSAYEAMGGIKCALPAERDMTLKWRRRLKAIANIKAGDVLENEVNFGAYRSKEDDVRAGAPERVLEYHGQIAKRDLAIGQGIWIDDVE